MNLTDLRKEYVEKRSKYDKIKTTAEMEEVRSLHGELTELKERIELLQNERDLELEELQDAGIEQRKQKSDKKEIRDLSLEELDEAYERTFLKAFRKEKLTKEDRDIYDRVVEVRDAPNTTPYLQSAVDEDGGFIVPHSVSTMIQEYKREQEFDLTTLISVQTTSVLSGEFTYEKLDAITPFENVSQWETIGEVETPQFERKEYKIDDYAGILPIPRTLLQDTDQNLLAYIAKYIAKKSLVTRNAKVLEVINTMYPTKSNIKNVDDIFDALDLELDQAFIGTTSIVTNNEGFNFLRKLKNERGENLLQPDVTNPSRRAIDGHPVEVLPTRTLPSKTGKFPLFIGDFKEAVQMFDRGVYEITPTTIGGDAFKRNSYDIRVIDRFDVIELDKAAVVPLQIDPSKVDPDPAPEG